MSDTPKEVLQEQFNKVYRHLMAQGEQSRNEDGCAYRGDNGLMCAAGACIPESDYDPRMEEKTWSYVCTHFPGASTWLDEYLGSRLQEVHDEWEVLDWKTELTRVAEDFGLEAPQ